jgi:hypothetical protein
LGKNLKDPFLIQDLYNTKKKKSLKSTIMPLTCYICKKELNGISITAKIIDGKTIFLCSHHYQANPYQIVTAE